MLKLLPITEELAVSRHVKLYSLEERVKEEGEKGEVSRIQIAYHQHCTQHCFAQLDVYT